MKSNAITDRTVYSDYKSEAWAAALNILAVEFLLKRNNLKNIRIIAIY